MHSECPSCFRKCGGRKTYQLYLTKVLINHRRFEEKFLTVYDAEGFAHGHRNLHNSISCFLSEGNTVQEKSDLARALS